MTITFPPTGWLRRTEDAGLAVSRETQERLQAFVGLLQRWQARINLIGRGTTDQIWLRHILDSAQVVPLVPDQARVLVDLGAGAGLPGLVIAAFRPDLAITLVESDARKAAFLGEASRRMGLPRPPKVEIGRIEAIPALGADVVTARALASLPDLIAYADRHRSPTGICLFHKGKGWRSELTEAMKNGDIPVSAFPSVTDRDAVILRIGPSPPAGLRHRQPEGGRG